MNEKAPWIGRNFSVFGIIRFLNFYQSRIFKPIKVPWSLIVLQKARKKKERTTTPFIPIHHDPVHNHPVHFSLPSNPFSIFQHQRNECIRNICPHGSVNNPPPCTVIGNVEKFIHACKIIETLETDVRLLLSIVAEPEPSSCFFPTRRVRTSESASKLSCIRWGRRTPGGGPCPGRSSMSDWYVAWGGGAGLRSKPVREYKKLQDAYPNGGRLMVPTESPIRVD